MRPLAALPLVLAFASTPALAGGWGDFVSSFTTSPCQDGWLGCVVGNKTVSPNLVRDNTGAPTPADLRVGWFDLDGLPSFSPFPELSQYTGKPATPEPPAVAVADDPPAPRVTDTPSRPSQPSAPSPSPSSDGGRTASAPQPAASTGTRSGGSTASAPPASGTPEPAAATGSGTSIAQLDKELARSGTADPPKAEQQAAIKTAAPAADSGDCSEIKRLEPMAMLGRLSPEQRTCLEGEIGKASRQTEKDKISRVLMANAWAANDKKEWEKLVKRHLDEIDRSDPDLCYKYAMHLARKGPGSASAVIRWADVALENKTVWTGTTYTNRVNSLLKLRADAAQKAWIAAEEKYTSEPNDANLSARDNARNRTKVLAREWYEYAKQVGRGADPARQLCVSAAGTEDYCEGS